MDLIVVRVGGSDWVWRRSAEGVVVGYICFEIQSVHLDSRHLPMVILTGGKTAEGFGRASILVDLGEELSGGSQIGGPPKPSSVTSIEVHANVEWCQCFYSIGNALFIRCLGSSTLRLAKVGDHVGQRIRFNDGHDGDRRILYERTISDLLKVTL